MLIPSPHRRGRSAERCLSVLRGTLDATSDGILVVDRDGVLVAYNERFLELWHIPGDLARQSSNPALIHFVTDQLCDPERFLDLCRENQAHPELECFSDLRFLDGRVLERLSRPQQVDREVVGRVLAFKDVSERARLQARVQDAVRERAELLSVAAHEIRTPLSSMRLAVQTLRDGRCPPEMTAQALDIIERGQRRVSALVEKLLDLGRLQAGALFLEREPTDLVEVVCDVIARLKAELERSGSRLCLRADQAVVGRWDRLRLEQVVTNLLTNAIKYGGGKPIRIDVAAGAGVAVLEVQDQGLGIPAEVQGRIFEAFQRAGNARPYDGAGLGLHIVRTIVQASGGRVTVSSQAGAGATFRVELPQEGVPVDQGLTTAKQ